MAAVDKRLGVVRRGITPAAPKPINLPSQKLENHQLIPEVEIVPRGTCCWGNAGRSTLASVRNNDQTVSASGSDGTADHESKSQTGLVLADEVQSPVEKSDLSLSVESDTSSPSSTTCVISETSMPCPHVRIGNSIYKAGSDSPAMSTGSPPESIARPSSSGSGSSSPVSPSVLMQDQKQLEERSEIFETYLDDHEKVSNMQAKQETHFWSESQRGSQDFGYFEGFYSTQAPFPRPGMSYSSSQGMAFGNGLHPEAPQHYSFLGVPYYDSVKNKEIVVITMVGNPGYYGSYLPYPGFANQYSGPTHGNFPLQFGHFEHYVGPQVSSEMNPLCPSEDPGFVSYEQDSFKQCYANGRSAGIVQRNNSACFPTSFSTCEVNSMSEDCGILKRIGRQKPVTRNKKATSREASDAGFEPERRVTLLTKVSQHEVIISNSQRKNKHGGVRQAKCSFAPHSSAQDVSEIFTSPQPVQRNLEVSVCAPQAQASSLPVQASSSLMVEIQSGTSQSMPGQAPLKSSEAAAVVKFVEVNKTSPLDDPRSLSADEVFSLQVPCNEDSSCLSSGRKDAKMAEPLLTCVFIPPSVSAASSAPIISSEVQNELGVQQGSLPMGSTRTLGQLPIMISSSVSAASSAPITSSEVQNELSVQQGSPPEGPTGTPNQLPISSMETFCVTLDNSSEVSCDSKYGVFDVNFPGNDLVEAASTLEPASECSNDTDALSSSTVTCLLNEHMPGLPVKNYTKKWRRKGSVDVTKLETQEFKQNFEDSVVEKTAFFHESSSITSKHGSSTTARTKIGGSLLARVNVALDGSFKAGTSNGVLDCMQELRPDQVQDSSTKPAPVVECMQGLCLDQVQDSSIQPGPVAGGHNSHSRTVISGAGKKWMPKISGEPGHKNSATKLKTGREVTTSCDCSPQIPDSGLVNNCSSNHILEVLCDDNGIEHYKEELHISVACSKGVQDEGCKGVPKVSPEDQTRETLTRQPSHSENVQGDRINKLLHRMQGQHGSEDFGLIHGVRISTVISAEPEETISWGNSSTRNVNSSKQCHAWRISGKQMSQPKVSVPSELEESEHRNSVAKSKKTLYFVQGASRVSWKPKHVTAACTFKEGSVGGVKAKTNIAIENTEFVEGKEEGPHRPFSTKLNSPNDDNMKAAQLEQSVSYSSNKIEHVKAIGNVHAVEMGFGESHSLSRTCVKLGRRTEFHIAKKTDKKGWVVKSETASAKA